MHKISIVNTFLKAFSNKVKWSGNSGMMRRALILQNIRTLGHGSILQDYKMTLLIVLSNTFVVPTSYLLPHLVQFMMPTSCKHFPDVLKCFVKRTCCVIRRRNEGKPWKWTFRWIFDQKAGSTRPGVYIVNIFKMFWNEDVMCYQIEMKEEHAAGVVTRYKACPNRIQTWPLPWFHLFRDQDTVAWWEGP